jgi:hypothetical protein
MSPQMLANETIGVQLETRAPVADTLDTGEQQTRLPGEVGAVRDEERAQPTETVPGQSLRLTAEEAPKAQGSLDAVFAEADRVLDEEAPNPFTARLAKARAALERLSPTTARDAQMADSFPLGPGVGRGDNARRIDRSVKTAVEITKLSQQVRMLEAQERAFAEGRINRQGRPVTKKATPRRAAPPTTAGEDDLAPMTGWHGSPHRFTKFSLHKIGTGEGAQAFGWGLYFASMRKIAEYYRATLSNKPARDSFRNGLAEGLERKNFTAEQWRVIQALEADQRLGFDSIGSALTAAFSSDFQSYEPSAELVQAVEAMVSNRGALYRVEIPEHGDYLDWGKPLREQGEKVQAALRGDLGVTVRGKRYDFLPTTTGREIYQHVVGDLRDDGQGRAEERASRLLAEAGIPGIQYRDSGSRYVGDGSYNYVVFDDALVTVEETIASMAKPRSASAHDAYTVDYGVPPSPPPRRNRQTRSSSPSMTGPVSASPPR